MQCEIAAVYMSGNLRRTKQLISELTKHDAAISIAVKRVTAKTSRRTPGLVVTVHTETLRVPNLNFLRKFRTKGFTK